jgi:hypothetical protein
VPAAPAAAPHESVSVKKSHVWKTSLKMNHDAIVPDISR